MNPLCRPPGVREPQALQTQGAHKTPAQALNPGERPEQEQEAAPLQMALQAWAAMEEQRQQAGAADRRARQPPPGAREREGAAEREVALPVGRAPTGRHAAAPRSRRALAPTPTFAAWTTAGRNNRGVVIHARRSLKSGLSRCAANQATFKGEGAQTRCTRAAAVTSKVRRPAAMAARCCSPTT
jgi:hypothetical protein